MRKFWEVLKLDPFWIVVLGVGGLLLVAQLTTGAPSRYLGEVARSFVEDQTDKLRELEVKANDLERLVVEKDVFYEKQRAELVRRIQEADRKIADKDSRIQQLATQVVHEKHARAQLEAALLQAKATPRTLEEIHAHLRTLGHRPTAPRHPVPR